MRICTKCLLPETFPGIEFDSQGVCSQCRQFISADAVTKDKHFSTESELISALDKYRNPANKYDVLVPVSGGVDSSNALIQIVEKYKLRPLIFHNDHGYEDSVATQNVQKLAKTLDADLVIWQHDYTFMKKLWKYINEADVVGLSACYVCGNILYVNALELANRFQIPLVMNGYSKGQAKIVNDKEQGNAWLKQLIQIFEETGDQEFLQEFMQRYEILEKQMIYNSKEDLLKEVNSQKIMVIPFYIFQFYHTDKDALNQMCKDRFDWCELKSSYPARTTNCEMIWLNTYMDLQKMNYSVYHAEYSELVRIGEMTREQAKADLEFNPPPGLLERLAQEVGVDLARFRTQEKQTNPDLKIEVSIDFDL